MDRVLFDESKPGLVGFEHGVGGRGNSPVTHWD
jgi:hypothetical protein